MGMRRVIFIDTVFYRLGIWMSLDFFKNGAYREKKISSWVAVGFIVFTTAFLWAPSRDGLEGIYALAIFIPMLCLLPWRKPSLAEYGGTFTLLGLLFAGYSAVTAFWAPDPDPGFFILQFFILASWLCGLGWMAQRELIDLPNAIKILIEVGTVLSIINLIAFYVSSPLFERLQGWSVTRNPNHIGSVFGILTLLAYIEWLRAQGFKQSLWLFCCMVILLASVLASQTRAAFIGLALLMPFAAFVYCRNFGKWLLQLVAVLLVAILIYSYRELVQEILFARGLSIRDVIWSEVFARSLQDHTLLGIGLEKEGRIVLTNGAVFNHAHNAWLDMFYRTGLVGMLLSVIYLGYLFRHALCHRELYPLLLWLAFGCIYSLVDSRGFFWQIDPKWFCIWLPAGLIGALISAKCNDLRALRSAATQQEQS
jgi:hypothetical protein